MGNFVGRPVISCGVVIFHNRNDNLIFFLHCHAELTDLRGSLLYINCIGNSNEYNNNSTSVGSIHRRCNYILHKILTFNVSLDRHLVETDRNALISSVSKLFETLF